jgi:hypothetical protein
MSVAGVPLASSSGFWRE